jgi:hypothetical protein
MNQIKSSLYHFVGQTTQKHFLPISSLGLILGDRLLLIEARESKDMKERTKLEETKGLLLISRFVEEKI